MNVDRAFVDTNVFIYLFSNVVTDSKKRQQAYSILQDYDCQISTQVLNEFSNVCIRKWNLSVPQIKGLLNQIMSYCDTSYIYEDTIEQALDINEKYGYSYYDSLMISSALERGCKYLISEDMADGQVIEGTLTIKNVFV